ncbi:MAG: SpoVA/SpoVAEb family sporulation membrane protein [Lachnospiraceae bacterium]
MEKNEEYIDYIKNITPKHPLGKQLMKAFFVGGTICLFGQVILSFLTNYLMLEESVAASYCSLLLIGLSALLTTFSIYGKIVTFGGAGALVPITGFANSIASAAIEYDVEGEVYGIGTKIFSIAGPVILYGIFGSFIGGLIYYIWIYFF